MELHLFHKGFNYSQDGPGNRMVYHLQGCNLRCPWCSNPEGLALSGGECCSVDQLVMDAISCRMMFFDGGGITLTGGEITVQFEAVKELLIKLKKAHIHTAVETNGIHPRLPELFPFVDYLIMDCKHYDTKKHQTVTGISNSLTHRNIALAIEAGIRPAIRIPLIGGFNATEEDAHAFAALFQRLQLPGNGTLELLPYHEYGKEKYQSCGLEYTMTEQAKISPKTLEAFTTILRNAEISMIRT